MPAPSCSPNLPTPCYGRAEARERGIGVWYADDLRTWLWVPEEVEFEEAKRPTRIGFTA